MSSELLPTRRLGKTEIAVSYPALGCGALMGAGNDADAVKIVHRAIELGINCEPRPRCLRRANSSQMGAILLVVLTRTP